MINLIKEASFDVEIVENDEENNPEDLEDTRLVTKNGRITCQYEKVGAALVKHAKPGRKPIDHTARFPVQILLRLS